MPSSRGACRPRRCKRGLILLTCGVDANVIRFLFPLRIQPLFDEALGILRDAFSAAA